jgi:hypothetical protein
VLHKCETDMLTGVTGACHADQAPTTLTLQPPFDLPPPELAYSPKYACLNHVRA